MIREIANGTRLAELMYDPDTTPYVKYYQRPFEAAAQAVAIEAVMAPVNNNGEIESSIEALGRKQSCLVVLPSAFMDNRRAAVAAAATRSPPSRPIRSTREMVSCFHMAPASRVSFAAPRAAPSRRSTCSWYRRPGLLYGLLILRQSRRELVWLDVTAHPNAEWLARQLTEACGWDAPPRYLIRDGAYGAAFIRRIGAMGIRDRPVDGNVLITSSSLASAIFATFSHRTKNTTTRSERTYRCGRTRRFSVMCAEQGA
jgi:hypothetical protein